jgi:hypothetical protein
MVLLAMLGLALAGLPLTGGAFAKYAIKTMPMGDVAKILLTLSAAGTTALTWRAALLLGRGDASGEARGGLLAPCAVLFIAAIALPSLLFPAVTGTTLAAVLSLDALATALWPIALGLIVVGMVQKFEDRLPEIPAGDVYSLVLRLGPAVGRALDTVAGIDARLKQWPVAGTTLVALAALLVAATMR